MASVSTMLWFRAKLRSLVDRITSAICKMSAKEASDLTHDELWKAATFSERIPVAAAAPVEGNLTPEIRQWAEAVIDAESPAT